MDPIKIILSGVDDASDEIKGASGALDGLASVAGGALKLGLAAGVAGFAALGTAMVFSVGQALGNEKIQASLAQAIKASGGAAGITADAANDLAQSFVHLAGGSDDLILQIETIGIRAGTISKDEMPAFIQSTLDLGAVMGDATGAATLLARAQEDPIAALGKLQRAGIIFTDALKDQIKELVKNNDVAGATALIMGRVAEATGGAAAANAATLTGQWEILKGTLGEAAESVGMSLLPLLHDLNDNVIKPLIPVITELGKQFGYFFAFLASGDTASAFDTLYEAFDILSVAFPKLREQIQIVQAAFVTIWEYIQANWPTWRNTVVTAAQDAYTALQPVIAAAINVARAFIENMPIVIQSVKDMAAFVLAQINILSPTLIANVTDMLNQLAIFWREHGDEVMLVIKVAFEFIVVTVGGALTLLSGLIAAALKAINGDWSGAWKSITDTLETFMNMALAIVGTNLDEFTAVWKGNWENALLIVTTIWTLIKDGVADLAMGMTSEIQAAIISIVNWLIEYVPQFVAAGAALLNGMIAGARSMAGALISAVIGPINDAIAAAKALLGIHSPSTVFAGIGANMMSGMAMGIAGNAYRPAMATAGAVTNVTNNYNVAATYGYQSEGSVAQELRLMSKLRG